MIASLTLCGCLLVESTALVSASECELYGVQTLHLVSQPINRHGIEQLEQTLGGNHSELQLGLTLPNILIGPMCGVQGESHAESNS